MERERDRQRLSRVVWIPLDLPHQGVSGGSWVAVNMNGYAYLSSGYTAGIGPVLTWNYVTWLSMPIRRSERWMKVIKGKLVAFLAEIVNLISGAPW